MTKEMQKIKDAYKKKDQEEELFSIPQPEEVNHLKNQLLKLQAEN